MKVPRSNLPYLYIYSQDTQCLLGPIHQHITQRRRYTLACRVLSFIYPDKVCWVCIFLERLLSLQDTTSFPIHKHTHIYIHLGDISDVSLLFPQRNRKTGSPVQLRAFEISSSSNLLSTEFLFFTTVFFFQCIVLFVFAFKWEKNILTDFVPYFWVNCGTVMSAEHELYFVEKPSFC